MTYARPEGAMEPSCNICGSQRFVDMAPNPRSIFTRPNAQCAACGSLERHRLLYELLATRNHLAGQRRVLHIAPEIGLARVLHARFGEGYLAVDIDPARYKGVPVRRLDLCGDLATLEPGSFDIVIHNHVLEHLACDYASVLRALDSLVAPGGVHAFSVPFMDGGYREDLSATSDTDRLARFGQTDHVRMFSPIDAATTLGSVVDLPDPYDATALVDPSRLAAIIVPETQWHGYNNNAVFFLEKPDPDKVASKAGSIHGAAAEGPRQPAVLFVSANGIGRGHLTRQLAIAQRLRTHRPVFLTMSYAARLVAARGHLVQFLPHHKATGEDPPFWQERLTCEIEMLLDGTGAQTLVYDVNFVFDGVIEVLRRRKSLRSIWVRRAMWPQHHRPYLGAAVHFTKVVEPGDLAESMDEGPTVNERDAVLRVPPVLLAEPGERLPRQAAREALGLPMQGCVVMLDLSQTRIGAYAELRRTVLRMLAATPDLIVLELKPAIDDAAIAPLWPGHRVIALDEAFRHSLAWDAAISRCGYNSFHEAILGVVPSVFVPNTEPDMDSQATRAHWAQSRGCAIDLAVDADEPTIQAALSKVLDPQWRRTASLACEAIASENLRWINGAHAIASLIEDS